MTVMLRSVKRSHRKELSFCAKQSEVAESTGEPSNCHSARSEAKSQNLLENHRIVILREAKRSRRIYRRINDGFCNSGQKRPPCRMTRWMDDNELKDLRFCLIHQLPKKFRFSHQLSLLTLSFCAKQCGVAESLGEPSNCHSARSEVKRSRRIYCRTRDGFCNSGRRRPPCRMT